MNPNQHELIEGGRMHFHRIPYMGWQLAQDAFYCKKRDESGNVTHVCKIREELRRFVLN